MSWQLFDREAERYESWYATARGRRAFVEEARMLDGLVEMCHGARTVLDVGCGCGRFTSWLAERGLRPIALDRSPEMLRCLRRRSPTCPALLADAHALPLRDHAVDLVVFVTTLEFLEDPPRALAEAVRVAARGVIALVLNRWSLGALSRRHGPASLGKLLSHARDMSPPEARRLLTRAAGERAARLDSRSTLFPVRLLRAPSRVPFGDVLGVVAVLRGAPAPLQTASKHRSSNGKASP